MSDLSSLNRVALSDKRKFLFIFKYITFFRKYGQKIIKFKWLLKTTFFCMKDFTENRKRYYFNLNA